MDKENTIPPTDIQSASRVCRYIQYCADKWDIQMKCVPLSFCTRANCVWEVDCGCRRELPGHIIVPIFCAAVFEELCCERTQHAVKETEEPHRCLMRSILDGLVICLWLFFMLHLPLFGCSKIPGTLYWFSRHDVKRRTELVGIVSGSECWHREGRFLHSHALPPQCVSC